MRATVSAEYRNIGDSLVWATLLSRVICGELSALLGSGLRIIEWMGPNVQDGVLRVDCVVLTVEDGRAPLPSTTYGQRTFDPL